MQQVPSSTLSTLLLNEIPEIKKQICFYRHYTVTLCHVDSDLCGQVSRGLK